MKTQEYEADKQVSEDVSNQPPDVVYYFTLLYYLH